MFLFYPSQLVHLLPQSLLSLAPQYAFSRPGGLERLLPADEATAIRTVLPKQWALHGRGAEVISCLPPSLLIPGFSFALFDLKKGKEIKFEMP